MLTTTISSTSAMSSAAGAISITTGTGLPEYGVLAVIALIALLSAKEILSVSEKWSKDLNSFLNMGISPLLIAFTAIVVFKIAEIIYA